MCEAAWARRGFSPGEVQEGVVLDARDAVAAQIEGAEPGPEPQERVHVHVADRVPIEPQVVQEPHPRERARSCGKGTRSHGKSLSFHLGQFVPCC